MEIAGFNACRIATTLTDVGTERTLPHLTCRMLRRIPLSQRHLLIVFRIILNKDAHIVRAGLNTCSTAVAFLGIYLHRSVVSHIGCSCRALRHAERFSAMLTRFWKKSHRIVWPFARCRITRCPTFRNNGIPPHLFWKVVVDFARNGTCVAPRTQLGIDYHTVSHQGSSPCSQQPATPNGHLLQSGYGCEDRSTICAIKYWIEFLRYTLKYINECISTHAPNKSYHQTTKTRMLPEQQEATVHFVGRFLAFGIQLVARTCGNGCSGARAANRAAPQQARPGDASRSA